MEPTRHRALVDRLVADARPVQPLWTPSARFALWALFPALGFAVAIGSSRMPDLGAHFADARFVAELVGFTLAALWCGALALRASTPGGEARPFELVLAGLLVLGPLALVCTQAPETIRDPGTFVLDGLACTGYSLVFAALPWTAALIALRRGAPLGDRGAAALAGAAAFLAAAAALRMACPLTDGRWHLLAWHLLPVAIGVAASASFGALWIRGWRRP
jgi:hypothetical protein